MEKKQCCKCGKVLEGYATDSKALASSGNIKLISSSIGNQCQSCGAVYCDDENRKHLKFSFWKGFEKSICVQCGQPFGPSLTFTTLPFSDADKAEAAALAAPASVPTAQPRQDFELGYLCDAVADEHIVDEWSFDKKHEMALVLTNKRLIYKCNVTSGTMLGMLVSEPIRCRSWSWNKVIAVETNEKWSDTELKITVNYDSATQAFVWKAEKGEGILRFAAQVRKLMETGAVRFDLPAGEELLFNYEWGLRILQRMPIGAFKALHNNHIIHLAATNQRILFYEIDQMTGGKHNGGYGAPCMVYCSIPFGQIKEVKISNFMYHNVEFLFSQPLVVWRVPGLRIWADGDLVYSPADKNIIASGQILQAHPDILGLQKIEPFGKAGADWKQVFLEGDGEYKTWEAIEPILASAGVKITGKK